MERMGADGDHYGQGFAACLGILMIDVHAPARVQRHAEPVLPLEHEPMEAGGIDADLRVAGGDLPGRDVGRRVHFEMERDGQAREVHVLALEHHLLPGGGAEMTSTEM